MPPARRGTARRLVGVALLVGLLVGSTTAQGAKPVSPGFFGVVPQAPPSAGDFARMTGVIGTLRLPLQWLTVEGRRGVYDLDEFESILSAAAKRGIRVLPFVYGTPLWLSRDPARAPYVSREARGAWTTFLRELVERYGPHGRFWHDQAARTPIRRWQIWNEPNFRLFWRPRPSPRGYARLLAISARAIRGVHPGARTVLAGLAPVRTTPCRGSSCGTSIGSRDSSGASISRRSIPTPPARRAWRCRSAPRELRWRVRWTGDTAADQRDRRRFARRVSVGVRAWGARSGCVSAGRDRSAARSEASLAYRRSSTGSLGGTCCSPTFTARFARVPACLTWAGSRSRLGACFGA